MTKLAEIKVIIACDGSDVVSALLKHIDQREIQIFRRLRSTEGATDPQTYAGGDSVIFDIPRLRLIVRKQPEALTEVGRSMRIILALDSQSVVDALDCLDLCHGCIFLDLNLDRANDIIRLAQSGYCLLPQFLIPTILANRLRAELVASLSETELQVLRLLGRACSNREIAARLNLSEARTKGVVRSTLTKLRFRNRTEAGVFATRYGLAPPRSTAKPDDG